jgi:hypothetical protein
VFPGSGDGDLRYYSTADRKAIFVFDQRRHLQDGGRSAGSIPGNRLLAFSIDGQ